MIRFSIYNLALKTRPLHEKLSLFLGYIDGSDGHLGPASNEEFYSQKSARFNKYSLQPNCLDIDVNQKCSFLRKKLLVVAGCS